MSASIPTSAKASSTSERRVALLQVCTVGITARAFLLPLLQRLQRDGYDVWLACTDDADARWVAGHGIPFFPVTISRRISPRDLCAIVRLYRFIRQRRFLIVNTHTSKGGFVGRVAAWLARVPCIIYTAHGYTVHAFQPRLVQWFYTLLDNWIGQTIGVARPTLADVRAYQLGRIRAVLDYAFLHAPFYRALHKTPPMPR